MQFKDMVEFELNIQKDRLRYIETTLAGGTHCPFPPRKIYIEPTNICNYRCVHCVHNGALTRKQGYLDLELYKRRMDEIEDLRLHSKIQFTGVGEPLLHPRWDEIVRHAADKGFFTLMNSNASLLTPENCERLVASGLDYLHVSIDGLTKATYESIRRGGNFERVMENLFNLFEARYKAKGYHLAVVLGIIDQERNRGELERFLAFFEKWPFHHVVSGELFNQMGTVEEASRNYESQRSMPCKSHPVCNTPWDLLSVNCDGQAVGCNYDFDNRFVTGDLHKQGILDIWNSERMQVFRRSVLDHDYANIEDKGPLCSECTIKWQKDYYLPEDFSSEVERMEQYLTRAIHRCVHHEKRNLEFRLIEEQMLPRRKEILADIRAMSGV
jgi:pyruvate-formate lyase-activating enzyme